MFSTPRGAREFLVARRPALPGGNEGFMRCQNLDRYIRVEPYGQWAFLDAVNELFKRKGITDNDIKKVQGKPEWFQKDAILADNPCKENVRETLTLLKYLAGSDTLEPEKRLKEIQEYITNQLYTVYK